MKQRTHGKEKIEHIAWEAAPITTSSGILSSLASWDCPSTRTRSESTCFRRIRLRNPPPQPHPPPRPLLPGSNAIKIAGGGNEPRRKRTDFLAGFDQKTDKGISHVPRIARRLDGEREEEKARGRDGDGGSSASGQSFALSLSFFSRRVSWLVSVTKREPSSVHKFVEFRWNATESAGLNFKIGEF
jgi:hypothetical protein